MTPRTVQMAGAALLVVVGIWAGAKVYSTRAPPQPNQAIPNPSDSAQIPAEPVGGPMPPGKIPDRLPRFSLGDRTGRATSIASFGTASLVINFWATWCAPCRREIPLLQSLHSEWAGRDVTVVGIAVDHRDKVLEFADRLNIAYPLLIGEQDALDAAAALGLQSPVFPFTVFTDRRGEVVALFVGELHRPQAELILEQVQNLNQDREPLAAAREAIRQGLAALGEDGAG
jgi:thiol-disulfide isomerase/thioredoxin